MFQQINSVKNASTLVKGKLRSKRPMLPKCKKRNADFGFESVGFAVHNNNDIHPKRSFSRDAQGK